MEKNKIKKKKRWRRTLEQSPVKSERSLRAPVTLHYQSACCSPARVLLHSICHVLYVLRPRLCYHHLCWQFPSGVPNSTAQTTWTVQDLCQHPGFPWDWGGISLTLTQHCFISLLRALCNTAVILLLLFLLLLTIITRTIITTVIISSKNWCQFSTWSFFHIYLYHLKLSQSSLPAVMKWISSEENICMFR